MLQNMYVVQDGAAYTALTDLTREEDERSFKNSIIGNSVNFFADPAIHSAGQQFI